MRSKQQKLGQAETSSEEVINIRRNPRASARGYLAPSPFSGRGIQGEGHINTPHFSAGMIIISSYVPPKVPNKQWRALIRKIWEVDPLECPGCGGEMGIIGFIQEKEVIEKILRHVQVWSETENVQARGSPEEQGKQMSYDPYYDDMPYQQAEELACGEERTV